MIDSSSECGLTDDIVQQQALTLTCSSSSAGLSKPTFDSLPPTLVSRDLTQDTSHSDSHSQDLLVQDTTHTLSPQSLAPAQPASIGSTAEQHFEMASL